MVAVDRYGELGELGGEALSTVPLSTRIVDRWGSPLPLSQPAKSKSTVLTDLPYPLSI